MLKGITELITLKGKISNKSNQEVQDHFQMINWVILHNNLQWIKNRIQTLMGSRFSLFKWVKKRKKQFRHRYLRKISSLRRVMMRLRT